MIVLNTTPINNALNDFFENSRTGSALYKLDFDEVVQRTPEFSQDNNPTNTIKVEALESNWNTGSGFAFLNMNLPPLSSHVLNFATWVKLRNYKSPNNIFIPTISSAAAYLLSVSSYLMELTSQTLPKNIADNTPQSTSFQFRSIFYIENFTEESLRAYPQFVVYYLIRHFLAVLHYNIFLSIPPVLVNTPIYTQPNLGSTNIKDIMHYFESYMYSGLEGEDDRIIFMLHPLDYQRLLRLKDSAGNYVFCSNCVWDNVIELGKSVIVNAGWNANFGVGAGLFAPDTFLVYPQSKLRFIYDGDLYFRIVRDRTTNRYSIEMYMGCKGETGVYSLVPFAGTLVSSWVLQVNYPALIGNV